MRFILFRPLSPAPTDRVVPGTGRISVDEYDRLLLGLIPDRPEFQQLAEFRANQTDEIR